VRETHHFATLIGYGANAINPYMAFETINSLEINKLSPKGIDNTIAYSNYTKAVGGGLLKIFSKMGISTLQSYHGAQIFEAIGLSDKVINKCFKGTVSRLGGIDFDGIAKEVYVRHQLAFPKQAGLKARLDEGGVYQWKQKGEHHLFNPKTVTLLQQAARNNSLEAYKEYANEINDQREKAITIRSLLDFNKREPISIDQVEPIENILKRFATGAMSFGSISHEAHSTLAIAMNRIGGKSNSGEGGEDEMRYELLPNGDSMRSAIKQVASGRFGVTSHYLSQADELQIKMAQGAKPGEGGQLPGHKVDDWIGRVRQSTPGVGLISPPPHHAAGWALSRRLLGEPGGAIAVVGDGELQEGLIWETLQVVQAKRIGGLTLVVDVNGGQNDGYVRDISPLPGLPARFAAFGFEVIEIDGHDIEKLMTALTPGEEPRVVLATTVKAKGVPAAEGRASSHYVKISPARARQWKAAMR
jgi:hypothetical protein